MMATSWSARSQPTTRPDLSALGPLTRSVQSPPLSSIHAPFASFFTISETAGGLGLAGFCGGLKELPELGGGFTPPQGPDGSLTTLGGKPARVVTEGSMPPPSTVVSLPDSKMPT